MAVYVFAGLCAVAVAALLMAELKARPKLKAGAKTAASAAFLAVALSAGATETLFGSVMLAGLVACAAGDILLLSDRDRPFLAGMGAFAAGHLAYAAAFFGAAPTLSLNAVLAFIGFIIIAGVFLTRLWPHLGAFRAPVVCYMGIIGAMCVASAAMTAPPVAAPPLLFAGAAFMFAISDIAVARDKFIAPSFANKAWGLPLYYSAQLIFASSL